MKNDKWITRHGLTFIVGWLVMPVILAQSFEFETRVGFPDFQYMEEPGGANNDYVGEVFILSDDYPDILPALDPEVQKILAIDYQTDPLAYVMAVRDYVFEGNIHGGDVSKDFALQNNTANYDWYHVPWQHWGITGREGYHGLTREGPLGMRTLGPEQKSASSAYAVGFYNGPGGYTIGKVWPSSGQGPDLSSMISKEGFPEGAVVAKFLFTVLDERQVPWLTNPLQWNGYIYDCDMPFSAACAKPPEFPSKRATQKLNLLQMDIMVKDSRATESAEWVFGTFTYNGNLPANSSYGEACASISGAGKNWCNLMPVGVMWGNDPSINHTFINENPTQTVINPELKQTWINPDPAMPAMHLGFNSRLNGPADNPSSSCMSCHSTGQYPSVSAIMPWLSEPAIPRPPNQTPAPADWMHWFRNFKDGENFDQNLVVGFDFSMQLAKSVKNYILYLNQTQHGKYALEYWWNKQDYELSRGSLAPSP